MADEQNNEIEATDASDVAAAADASADEPTTTSAVQESAAQSAGELEAFAEAEAISEHEAEKAAAASAHEAQAASEPAAEPQVQLTPKERKVAIKTRKAAKVGTRSETSNEDRQAERDAARAKKAAERRAGRAHARAKYKSSEHERTATPAREHVAGNQKTRQGIVISDKADKTITVRIDVARRHRKYQKIVRTSNTLHAHDELNDAHTGDTVVVRESRPLSRSKRWRLIQVVERAK
jgi:small subunit ribosomal protein S17